MVTRRCLPTSRCVAQTPTGSAKPAYLLVRCLTDLSLAHTPPSFQHYTAYSKEANRGHDTYNISMYDFWDSYLPQYEIAFKQGNASGVMCR